jgi:hypothetical protein
MVTVASELTVNAMTHAVGTAPVRAMPSRSLELWIYLVAHPEPRVVVSVFDADREHAPPGRPTAPAGPGRGLQVVAALSDAWGCRPTRSRIGPWLPGKAVWAAFSLPGAWVRARPVRSRPTPRAAADALHAELAARGFDRIYRHGDGRLQVLSVHNGLTVWIGNIFYWRDATGGYRHRALEDVVDTAEQIISRGEELGSIPGRDVISTSFGGQPCLG